jgi:hypothetical protein
MEGYIKVKAFELYKEKYADVTRINKRINQVKNRLSPRIAQTVDHSFEVWLAMDIVTFHGEDSMDAELRNGVVEGYKQEVLDVDFTSEEEARIIHEKYNDDQRKMIFDPLLKLLESDDFVISITDYRKTIKRKQNRVRVTQAFKKIVFPPPTIEEATAELEQKNKMVAFIFNLKEGADITKIGKKQLMDNLIFREEIAESPIDIPSPIVVDGQTINLKKSLRCILKVDVKGRFSISHDVLELYADGQDIEEITASIKRQFLVIVDQFRNNALNANDPKAEVLQGYI